MSASGIEGTVTIGPITPAIQDGDSSGHRPYETTLVVKEAGSGRQAATVDSGADGAFRIELPPGEYVIEPASRNQLVPPYADPQEVTVVEGEFTVIEIMFDSGIR